MANTTLFSNFEYDIDPSYASTSRYQNTGETFVIKADYDRNKIVVVNEMNERQIVSGQIVSGQVVEQKQKMVTKAVKETTKNNITWNIPIPLAFEEESNDYYYTIPKSSENRPDKISMDFYGNERYYWIVCQANQIECPEQELEAGKTIRIPSFEEVQLQLLNR